MQHFFSLAYLFFFLISFCLPLNAQWEQIFLPGHKGGGAVYSICFKDSKMVVATTGGVFSSEDEGEHWLKMNIGLPAREYSASALSLAVSEENFVAAYNGPGVYLSADDGITWSNTIIEAGVFESPQILAASKNWILGGNGRNAAANFYQSYDNGNSWSTHNFNSWIYSIAAQDSSALVATGSGVYLSASYGLSWEKVHDYFSVVSYCKSVAYAGLSPSGGFGHSYIFSSYDNGLTWNEDSSVVKCSSINAIVGSPVSSGSNFLFAATDSGVFRSSDFGNNWENVNNGINTNLIFSLTFRTNESDGIPGLYAGTANGIYKSTDYGENWTVVGGPAIWRIVSTDHGLYAVSSLRSYKGNSWFNSVPEYYSHSAVYYSTDDGMSWSEKFSGFLEDNVGLQSFKTADNNSLLINGSTQDYTGRTYSLLFLSEDQGVNWRKIYSQPSDYLITALEADQSDIFIGTFLQGIGYSSISRSTDDGNTWTIISPELQISLIKAISLQGDRVFVGGGKHYATLSGRNIKKKYINSIYFSNDKGNNWEKLKSPLDSGRVYNQVSDTLSSVSCMYPYGNKLLVGMYALNFSTPTSSYPLVSGGGVYNLVQRDSSWIVADSSMMGTSVFDFTVKDSIIFAATEKGVFHSTDFGTTWSDLSIGMNNIYVSSLLVSENFLYATTVNGIWKRSLSEITTIDFNKPQTSVQSNYYLSQNYPNPFNPTTTINFSISSLSTNKDIPVQLKVYDVMGREIATLVNDEMLQGNYQVTFDGSKLASGVYYYQLKVNGFMEAKKLILLK